MENEVFTVIESHVRDLLSKGLLKQLSINAHGSIGDCKYISIGKSTDLSYRNISYSSCYGSVILSESEILLIGYKTINYSEPTLLEEIERYLYFVYNGLITPLDTVEDAYITF